MNEIVFRAEINEETGDIGVQAYRVDGEAYTPVVLKARPGGMVVCVQPAPEFSSATGDGPPAQPGPLVDRPDANLPAEAAGAPLPADRAPGYGALPEVERPGNSPMQEPVGGRVEPLGDGRVGVAAHATGVAMTEADLARVRAGATMQPRETTPVDPAIAAQAARDAERQEEADRRAALEQARLGAASGFSGNAPGTQVVGA